MPTVKSNLNIPALIVGITGLITVMFGVFVLRSQALIVTGCLLAAISAGLSYRNANRDIHTKRPSE